MPNALEIHPLTHPFHSTVLVPGSKSITNRALPLAALADGTTHLTGVLFADDTWQMINALQTLGYHLSLDQKARTITITGQGKNIPPGSGQTILCGNSGTTLRFLTALLTLGTGDYLLDGVPRMRQRPIDQLVTQLRALGATITYDLAEGFPPLRIHARGLTGGGCSFSDAKSSQYISALLMAAPYAQSDVILNLLGPITSEPYVTMTLRMMEQFGASAQIHDQCSSPPARSLRIPSATYRPPVNNTYAIEPDASNASYFLAAATITPGSRVTISGLGKNSLQGDVAFADVLGKMGATVQWLPEGITLSAPTTPLRGIDLDMNHIPDMVQTLAIVALFATSPTTIRNVANLRIKETDRLAALETELRKLGATVTTTADSIHISPPVKRTPASIATYDDHRMAMAFAIAALHIPGTQIQNPECTAKTYPTFFDDLAQAVGPTT